MYWVYNLDMLSRVFISTVLCLPFHVFASKASHHTITVPAGEDVLLPCTFPPLDWHDPRNFLIIKWQHDYSIIYHYEDEEERPERGLEKYRGRFQLFHREVAKGNASALLKSIHLTDAGEYVCMVIWRAGHEEIQMQLSITEKHLPRNQLFIFGLFSILTVIVYTSVFKAKLRWMHHKSHDQSKC
ncbi:CD276 protein, partial [Polypterus senegalus]|nr:CD276 antigen homolog [Polypterus senegalus]MBN3292572.1 CD276 protein [Polypterus senegalus]